jgi:prevent-host-death family protein
MVKVSVTDAKGQLTELVKKAEEGEEVVLTRFGRPVARLLRIPPALSSDERRALLEELRAAGRAKATPGPCAARSQDFLYDEDGLLA